MKTNILKPLFITLLVSYLQLNAQTTEVRVQVTAIEDDIVFRNLKNTRNIALVGSVIEDYEIVCECEPGSIVNLGDGKFELDFTDHRDAKVMLYFVTSKESGLVDTIASKTLRILALPNNTSDVFNYWYRLEGIFPNSSASLLSKVELSIVKEARTYTVFHSDLPERIEVKSFVMTTKKKSGKVISLTIEGNRIDSSPEALALLNSLNPGSEVTLSDFNGDLGSHLLKPVIIQIF
jgi:hypothetical protein